MSIGGIDACGDTVNLLYVPEDMVLTIKAEKHVIERHKQVIRKLLHYPELVRFIERDAV